MELMSRTFATFDEDRQVWARNIRRLPRGHAFIRLVDDPRVYQVAVKRSAPGHLSWDIRQLSEDYPEALEDVERLIEQNFRSEFFVSPQTIEAETRERLERITGLSVPVRAIESTSTGASLTFQQQQKPDVLKVKAGDDQPFL
jgi:hypothetical protein